MPGGERLPGLDHRVAFVPAHPLVHYGAAVDEVAGALFARQRMVAAGAGVRHVEFPAKPLDRAFDFLAALLEAAEIPLQALVFRATVAGALHHEGDVFAGEDGADHVLHDAKDL